MYVLALVSCHIRTSLEGSVSSALSSFICYIFYLFGCCLGAACSRNAHPSHPWESRIKQRASTMKRSKWHKLLLQMQFICYSVCHFGASLFPSRRRHAMSILGLLNFYRFNPPSRFLDLDLCQIVNFGMCNVPSSRRARACERVMRLPAAKPRRSADVLRSDKE